MVVLFDYDRIRGLSKRSGPGDWVFGDSPAIEPIAYPNELLAEQVWGGNCTQLFDGITVFVDGTNLWARWKYEPNHAGTLLIADRARLKPSDAAFLREVLGLPKNAPLNDDASLRVALAAVPLPVGGPARTLEASRRLHERCAARRAAEAPPPAPAAPSGRPPP